MQDAPRVAVVTGGAGGIGAAIVTVNCVCPGPTDTALLGQVSEYSRRLYDGLARAIPMKRIAQPPDIAGVVACFASPAAGYVTGQTISVSGGLTMV